MKITKNSKCKKFLFICTAIHQVKVKSAFFISSQSFAEKRGHLFFAHLNELFNLKAVN